MRRRKRKGKSVTGAVAVAVGPRASANAVLKAAGAARHNVRAAAANERLREGADTIRRLGVQHGRLGDGSLGGRVAEEAHAATFSADAIMKGSPLRAERTASQVGRGLDPVDIEITLGPVVVSKAQVKYRCTAARAAKEVSAPQYDGQQLVVGRGQVAAVRNGARRLALKNSVKRPEQAARNNAAAERVSDRIKVGEVESRPLSRTEELRLAREARKGTAELAQVAERSPLREVARAGVRAAVAGGVISGALTAGISGVGNYRKVAAGEMSAADAVVSTATAAGLAAADGAARAAAGSILKAGAAVVAERAASQVVKGAAQRLAGSNVVFAAASLAIDGGIGAVRLLKGEIDGTEYALRVGESASSAAAGCGGALLGAAAGTAIFPVVGTAIGALLGGLGGGLGAGTVFRAIFR